MKTKDRQNFVCVARLDSLVPSEHRSAPSLPNLPSACVNLRAELEPSIDIELAARLRLAVC